MIPIHNWIKNLNSKLITIIKIILIIVISIYFSLVAKVIYEDIKHCDCVTNTYKTEGKTCNICGKPY